MSFIVSAFSLTGMAATLATGAVYGGLTTIGMNLIRGNDPFDNIGQGILMGGLTHGIFGGAGGAAGEGAINAGGLDGALGDSVSAYNANMGVNSGNAAVETIAKTTTPIAGMPSNTFGFDNQLATSQTFSPNSPYWSQSASGPTGVSDAPSVQAGQMAGTQAVANSDYPLTGRESSAGFRETGGRLVGTDPKTNWLTNPATPANNYNANVQNYFNPSANTGGNPLKLNAMSPSSGAAPASTASPKFSEDMLGYLTHKDNRLQVAAGGLGLAGAMGAFNRNTGLKNLPPRSYQRVNTSYNPGTVNPKYGMPGEPYFVGQGYGPETRETFYGAAGGGIRALSGGGETAPYMPRTPTGGMKRNEEFPDDPDAYPTFKRYLASNTNKKEEKGQAEIDKNVSSWLERYAKADIKGMAEGGPAQQVTQFQPTFSTAPQGIGSLPYQAPNVPAMESSPTDYNQSPQYAPTQQYSAPAANSMTTGLDSYLEGLQYKAPPPPPLSSGFFGNYGGTTPTPTLYNPATQSYSDNPAFTAPVATVAEGSDSGNDGYYDYGGGSGDGDKAGGPIKSQKYAMGGVTYNPDNQTYSPAPPQVGTGNSIDDFSSMNGLELFLSPLTQLYRDKFAREPQQYNYDPKEQKYQKYAMGGLAALPEYAAGGKLLSGDGDGMSDSIPAVIKGERPQRAALADGEFVIPADVVSHLGNGSTKAGGKRLYEMMANIRKARTGNPKQGKQINPMKFIPA